MNNEVPDRPLNQADAKNRALRTFLQGLAIDVGVAVAIALTVIFTDANNWSDLEWLLIGFTLLKTVLMAAAAFVMRRFIDRPGSVALPPNPPGSPSDQVQNRIQPRRDPLG